MDSKVFLLLLILLMKTCSGSSVDVSVQIYPSIEEISKPSEYQITFNLKNTIFAGASIKLDFSGCQIRMSDGGLSTCQYKPIGGTVVDYSGCSCTSNVCTVPVSATISNTFMQIAIGSLTNPFWVASQAVQIRITYNDNDKYSQTQATVSINSYKPSSIVSATLTQSSYIVKRSNQYLFAVTTVNPLPNNGRTKLIFPYSVSLDSVIKVYDINNNLLTHVQDLSAQNKMQIKVINQFSSGLAKNNVISLKVQNVINPASMTTSSEGIQVQTMTVDDQLIDQTDTSIQLKSKSTESESITVKDDKLYPQDATINKETKLFFQILPKLSADAGTVLFKITLPSNINLNSNSLSQSQIQSNPSRVISYDQGSKVITISQFSCSNTDIQFLQISGITNPSTTQNTGNFLMQIYEVSTDQLIQEYKGTGLFYTPLPGTLSVSSSARTSSVLSLDVDLSFVITPADSFQRGSFIYIYIPSTEVILKSSSSISCTKTVLGAILSIPSSECTIAELPSSTNSQMTVIVIKEWCTTSDSMTECAANTQLTFGLPSSFRNQDYVTSSTQTSIQIMIKTSDKTYLTDTKTSDINATPALVLNSVTFLSFTYLATFNTIFKCFASQANSYSILFKVNQYILDNNGQMFISFPKGALIQIATTSIPIVKLQSTTKTVTVVQHNDDDYLEGVKSISIKQLCDSSLCANNGQGLTLLISNFHNALSGQPIDTSSLKYVVNINNNDEKGVDQTILDSLNSVSYTPDSFDSLSISSSSEVVYNKASTITISFKCTLPFPASNHPIYPTILKIDIPSKVTLQSTSKCIISIINTIQLTCAITNQQLVVSYSSSKQNDYSLLMGKTIEIQVSNVINPQSTQPSAAFSLNLLTSQTYAYQSSSSLQLTMTTEGTLKSVTFTRSTDQPSKPISLSIAISLNTPLLKDSFIQIDISLQQIYLSSSDTISSQSIIDSLDLFLISTSSETKTVYSVNSIDKDYLKILIKGTHCPSDCGESSVMTYSLRNKDSQRVYMSNPQYEGLFAPSCKVFTRDPKNFPVDKLESGLMLKPSIAHGLMEVMSISSSGRVSSESTQLTAGIKTFSNIQTNSEGRVIIQPEQNMYYQDRENSLPICTALGTPVSSCSLLLTSQPSHSSLPKYISSVILDLTDAQIQSINANKNNNQVTVSGLLNYYLVPQSHQSQTVSISTTYKTATSKYSLIDQGKTTSSSLYPVTQATLSSKTITRSNVFFGQSTLFLYKVQLTNLLLKDSIFYLTLHTNQFTINPNGNPKCGFQVDSVFKSVPCVARTNSDNEVILRFALTSVSYCSNNNEATYCNYQSIVDLAVDGLLNPSSQILGLINVLSLQVKGPDDLQLAGTTSISSESFSQSLAYAPQVFSFSSFPTSALFLWILLFLLFFYILFSLYYANKHKQPYDTPNAFLSLFGIIHQLNRIFMVIVLFQNDYATLHVIMFVPVSANFILSFMMVQYYMQLFSQNIPKYSSLVEKHPTFFKSIKYASLLFGPKTFKLIQSGMYKMPFINLQQIVIFQQTLNKILIMAFLFSIWELIFDIVILSTHTIYEYSFHFAYSDLLLTICLETLFIVQMLKLRNKELKYQTLQQTNKFV